MSKSSPATAGRFAASVMNLSSPWHASTDAITKTDVAIVCDMDPPIHTPPRGQYPREIAWLKRMHAGGSILASVCSGSLLLAEAGLLDGIECAGHWAYRDLFREHYPNEPRGFNPARLK